jgi:hypothetical protein
MEAHRPADTSSPCNSLSSLPAAIHSVSFGLQRNYTWQSFLSIVAESMVEAYIPLPMELTAAEFGQGPGRSSANQQGVCLRELD